MKNATILELETAIEGLINFIAADNPSEAIRDNALRGLIQLRNELPNEREED